MSLTVGVIFGGRSVEHDVSIVTGTQFIENMDRTKYEVIPIYIAKNGIWYTGDALLDVNIYKNFNAQDKRLVKAYISPVPGEGLVQETVSGFFAKRKQISLHAAVLAMHGMHGEDGALQGLLELADIPYTSPGLVGSSVGMDKIVMKDFFAGMGLPVLESIHFLRSDDRTQIIEKIEKALSYPVYVKPANLGSSIGISKATDRASLENSIVVAAAYDKRILVEKCVTDITEINCSCRGHGKDVQVSVCEQPISWHDFLSFDDKYLRGKSSAGMKSLDRIIPAPVGEDVTNQIQDMTAHVFKELDCKGVVRIDYIYDNSEHRLYINEINTIPGSFSFYLWEPTGLSYKALIDSLIQNAIDARAEKNASVFAYDSNILSKAGKRGTKGGLKGGKTGN